MTALAMAAMMMASCASSDDGEQNVVDNREAVLGKTEVAFNAYANRGVSRSGLAGDMILYKLKYTKENKGGFGVFAYYTDLKKYDQTYVPNFMYNQGVFWNGEDGLSGTNAWEYSPVMYWPNEYGSYSASDDEDKVSFFAYAPYVTATSVASGSVEDATYGITGFSRNTAAGDPIVKYIASFDPAKSVDLCWGVNAGTTWDKIQGGGVQAMTAGLPWLDVEHPRTTGQKMTFTFKHALSQLNVQIDADPDITTHNETNAVDANSKVYVRSISFTGIALQGALNLNNAVANTAQWLDYSGTTDLPYGESVTVKDGRRDGREGAAGAEATNETPAGLNPDIIQNSTATNGVTKDLQNLFAGALVTTPVYVIPTGEAMTVTIVYDVETKNDNLSTYLSDGTTHGVSIENKITKTIAFDDVEGAGLESGKKYTLKLHLGMNSVKFNAAIDDWDDSVVEGEGWLPGNAAVRLAINNPQFSGPAPSRRMTRGLSGTSPVTVSFESGDAMGLYVMTSTGVKSANVKVTHNGAGWSTDSPIPYNSDYSYYIYYPYNSTAPTTASVGGGSATDFFSTLISGWTVDADQSTREKLMNQMLMVAKGTVSGSAPNNYTVTFTPENQMALIQLSDHKYTLASDANYTWEYLETDFSAAANKPYASGTKLYYVAAPGGANITFGTRSAAVPAGASGLTTDVITATNHTLAIGDIMADDGSLWSSYTDLAAQNTASGTSIKPIGFVFKTSTSTTDNTAGYTHGYVMSLYSANSGKRVENWSTGTADTWTQVTDKLCDVEYADEANPTADEIEMQWQNITTDLDGRKHCNTATTNYTTFTASDGSTLTAMKAAYKNNLIGSETPTGCSSWYLPSIGQLYEFVVNVTNAAEASYVPTTHATGGNTDWTWRRISGSYICHDFYLANGVKTGTSAKIAKKINDFLIAKGLTAVYHDGNSNISYELGKFQAFAKADSETPADAVGNYQYFWSSTERTASVPFLLSFDGYGILYLGGNSHNTKATAHLQVRSVLAF